MEKEEILIFYGAIENPTGECLNQLIASTPEGWTLWWYQLFPQRAEAALLLWGAHRIGQPTHPAHAFAGLGRWLWQAGARLWLSLWGLTRPSPYSREADPQRIDPFSSSRSTYLIVYPFSKTAEWYMLPLEQRRHIMEEHIRIGRQYKEITQLLVYSVGLADCEFVVAYETDDLAQFSALVMDLRTSLARPYTLRDTPILTGIRREPQQLKEIFGI